VSSHVSTHRHLLSVFLNAICVTGTAIDQISSLTTKTVAQQPLPVCISASNKEDSIFDPPGLERGSGTEKVDIHVYYVYTNYDKK
jgi:hypothetical protein